MNLQQLEYFLAAAAPRLLQRRRRRAAPRPAVASASRSAGWRPSSASRSSCASAAGSCRPRPGKTLRPHAEAVLEAVREARESVVAVRELRGGTASFGTFGTAR